MKKEQKSNIWKIVAIVVGAFVLCAAIVGIISGGEQVDQTERAKWAAWYQYDGETEQPDADVVVSVEELKALTSTAEIKGIFYNNTDKEVYSAKITLGFYKDDLKLDDCTVDLHNVSTGKTAYTEYCVYDRSHLEHDDVPTIKVDDVWYY